MIVAIENLSRSNVLIVRHEISFLLHFNYVIIYKLFAEVYFLILCHQHKTINLGVIDT